MYLAESSWAISSSWIGRRSSFCFLSSTIGAWVTFVSETFFPFLKHVMNYLQVGLGIWWSGFCVTTSKVSSARSIIKSTKPLAISMLTKRLNYFFSLLRCLTSLRLSANLTARSYSTVTEFCYLWRSAFSFMVLRTCSCASAVSRRTVYSNYLHLLVRTAIIASLCSFSVH